MRTGVNLVIIGMSVIIICFVPLLLSLDHHMRGPIQFFEAMECLGVALVGLGYVSYAWHADNTENGR